MRKLLLVSFLNCLLLTARSQVTYWQQQVDYTIDVALDDTAHSLSGFETIEYTNHSPDTLRYIWMHCWPNAYKNDKTAYTDQVLENGSTKFYFSDKEQKGYINRLNFKVNGVTATIEDHPNTLISSNLFYPARSHPGKKRSSPLLSM